MKRTRKKSFKIEPQFIQNFSGIVTHIILPSEAFFLSNDAFIKLKDILTHQSSTYEPITRSNDKA